MVEGKGLRSWLLVAFAAALLMVSAVAVPQGASAEPCSPECLPPPDENPEAPTLPKPPLLPRMLVVNIGWETERERTSAPLSTSTLTNHVEHLRNVVNPWFQSVSPLFKPWAIEAAGSYTITPPVTLVKSGGCDLAPNLESFKKDLLAAGDAAARAHGFDLSAYNTVVYVWSRNVCFGLEGFADTVTRRVALPTTDAAQHELGHLLGLPHANWARCKDASGNFVTLSNKCESIEYGDVFDTMGTTNNGVFNAIYQNRLGWMNGEVAHVNAGDFTQSWTLKPMSEPGQGLRAIRLVDGPTTLWIEYRQPTGGDAPRIPRQQELTYGVLIHREVEGRSQILDMTPPTSPFDPLEQPGMRAGQTWENPLGEMKITVTSRSQLAATVRISSRRVTVPEVRGLGADHARAVLEAARLKPVGFGPVVDHTCAFFGLVAQQEPFANSRVLPGTQVNVAIGEQDPFLPCF